MKKSAIFSVLDILAEMGTGKKEFFFDFDGTLSRIVNDPSAARPVIGAREALVELSAIKNCIVCVISGRDMADLKSFFPDTNLILCGNHGSEISGPGIHKEFDLRSSVKREINKIAALTNINFASIPGIYIEQKSYATAVHYRNVDEKSADEIEKWFELLMERIPADIRIRKGKKVFEIIPAVGFGKADAIRYIDAIVNAGNSPGKVLFAGDDTTDIEAFEQLQNSAIKIFVGKDEPEIADYSLESPGHTVIFIRSLVTCLGG